jgi:hypothetical protein
MDGLKERLGETAFAALKHRRQADIEAFEQADVTPSMLSSVRPESVKNEAQRRVRAAEAGSAVWFKHMRKAGGTSVLVMLDKAYSIQKACGGMAKDQRQEQQLNYTDHRDRFASSSQMGFTLHHQEFTLFPMKCLLLERHTVYITSLRDPVKRCISLFFYDGDVER